MKTLTIALSTAFFMTAQTAAGQVCMNPDELHAALVDWYQETPAEDPKDVGDSTTQLWASMENDTWTVVRQYSEESACVVAQGTDVVAAMSSPQQMAELILD